MQDFHLYQTTWLAPVGVYVFVYSFPEEYVGETN
jgi:hypothetical protein